MSVGIYSFPNVPRYPLLANFHPNPEYIVLLRRNELAATCHKVRACLQAVIIEQLINILNSHSCFTGQKLVCVPEPFVYCTKNRIDNSIDGNSKENK